MEWIKIQVQIFRRRGGFWFFLFRVSRFVEFGELKQTQIKQEAASDEDEVHSAWRTNTKTTSRARVARLASRLSVFFFLNYTKLTS